MGEVDSGFGALADRRRRLALFWLRRHRSLTLADLAELVAEREENADVADIPDGHVRNVYMSLYHTHVPQLEAAGLASYDQEADLVACAEECASTLERMAAELDALLDPPADEFTWHAGGAEG